MKKRSKKEGLKSLLKVINLSLTVLFMSLLVLLTVRGLEYIKIYLHSSSHFRLRRIVIDGNKRTKDEEIIKKASLKYGMNIFDVNKKEVEEKIKDLWWIKDVRVQVAYPDSIKIQVSERDPLFVVLMDQFYLLDRDYRIFKVVETPFEANLPVITGLSEEDYRDIKRRKKYLKTAQRFVDAFRRSEISTSYDIEEINVSSIGREGAIEVFLGGRLGMVKLSINDFDLQLKRLLLVDAFLREQDAKSRYVDLADYIKRGWMVLSLMDNENKRGG